jgi:hypothetical protein
MLVSSNGARTAARWSLVCAAAAFFVFTMPAARAGDDVVAASMGSEEAAAQPALTVKSCGTNTFCETGSVTKGSTTDLFNLAWFNSKTCAFVATGKWSEVKPPKFGKLSETNKKGTVGSGKCKGKPGTFADLIYKAGSKSGKDVFESKEVASCKGCTAILKDTLTVK